MIIIDLYENVAIRTDDARETWKERVILQLRKGNEVIAFGKDICEETIDSVFDEFVPEGADVLLELEEACSGILVVDDDEEGEVGVAIGFSSAERCSFPMPWPDAFGNEDEDLGAGDPTVFETVGVANGVPVKGQIKQA